MAAVERSARSEPITSAIWISQDKGDAFASRTSFGNETAQLSFRALGKPGPRLIEGRGSGCYGTRMTIRLHRGDLPDLSRYTGAVAIDTETMGLEPVRDRLCVVQLSPGDGSADVVQIGRDIGPAPNLKALLADASKLKVFHFARFDIAILFKALGVMPGPVYCTKIAS